MIILTDLQKNALRKFSKWHNSKTREKEYFVLSGISGSGKTTIIKYFLEEINLHESYVAFMAFTGKAAQVLTSKGHQGASTIHSTIYNCIEDKKGNYKLVLKQRAEINRAYKLFVVDECSMLNEQLIEDILYFNVPVLFVGDHNQLDPIWGKCFLLNEPDIRLNEPMRQARESSIIDLSYRIFTENLRFSPGKYGENVWIVNKKPPRETLLNTEQIICGYNRTRHMFNNELRTGKERELPLNGEKVICKKNNWGKYIKYFGGDLFLTNGLMGIAGCSVRYHGDNFYFYPDIGDKRFECLFDENYWEDGTDLKANRKYDKFDLGYAITCHASQGSEYENCVVITEPIGSDRMQKTRWLYTAITRAKNRLILVVN